MLDGPRRREATIGHLRTQTADGRIAFGSSVRHDASASTLSASQPLDETCDGRVRLYAKGGKLLTAQNTFVTAMQAPHLQNKLNGFHDQSSSASRVTAGALGFLTLTQQSLRPGRYGEPRRFDTMPSQPSAQA